MSYQITINRTAITVSDSQLTSSPLTPIRGRNRGDVEVTFSTASGTVCLHMHPDGQPGAMSLNGRFNNPQDTVPLDVASVIQGRSDFAATVRSCTPVSRADASSSWRRV